MRKEQFYQPPPNESLTPHQAHYRKLIKSAESNKYEAIFLLQSATYELPALEHNYKFDLPDSRMEMDFAHVPTKVGVEIQGGIYSNKRTGHSTREGIERDIRKINSAQMKGWLLILLSPQMVIDGSGALLAKEAIDLRQTGNIPQKCIQP